MDLQNLLFGILPRTTPGIIILVVVLSSIYYLYNKYKKRHKEFSEEE